MSDENKNIRRYESKCENIPHSIRKREGNVQYRCIVYIKQ